MVTDETVNATTAEFKRVCRKLIMSYLQLTLTIFIKIKLKVTTSLNIQKLKEL